VTQPVFGHGLAWVATCCQLCTALVARCSLIIVSRPQYKHILTGTLRSNAKAKPQSRQRRDRRLERLVEPRPV
jgi:hypothetical protein